MTGPYKVEIHTGSAQFTAITGPAAYWPRIDVDGAYKMAEVANAIHAHARQQAIAECVGVVEKWGSCFADNGSLALETAVEMVGEDLRALLASDSQETPNAD